MSEEKAIYHTKAEESGMLTRFNHAAHTNTEGAIQKIRGLLMIRKLYAKAVMDHKSYQNIEDRQTIIEGLDDLDNKIKNHLNL